jgi:hypothetical protein
MASVSSVATASANRAGAFPASCALAPRRRRALIARAQSEYVDLTSEETTTTTAPTTSTSTSCSGGRPDAEGEGGAPRAVGTRWRSAARLPSAPTAASPWWAWRRLQTGQVGGHDRRALHRVARAAAKGGQHRGQERRRHERRRRALERPLRLAWPRRARFTEYLTGAPLINV